MELKSQVTLDLAADACLLGSSNLAHYRRGHWPALIMAKDQLNIGVTGLGVVDGNSDLLVQEFERIKNTNSVLEFFPDAEAGKSLDIIGPTGVPTRFDPYELAQQDKLLVFVYGPKMERPYEFVRPQIIEFWGCRNIKVRGLTLRNAACWVQTYRDCEDLSIARLNVRSTNYWNNDGIDLVDCRRVKIVDCDIASADRCTLF